MKLEKKYDFRKKLLEIHEKDIRNNLLIPEANEFEFKNNSTVYFEEDDIVIKTAAEDFCDYLKTSMNVTASVTDSENATVKIRSAKKHNIDLKDADGYKGFMIECTDSGVSIYYYDNRGAAQALYYLEDLMTFRKAPFIVKETVYRKPLFAPRMTHSGYALDIFPDEHLAQMAHEGFDVVLLFVKDVNECKGGPVDFNDLIERCKKFGLDVYMYSYIHCKKNPAEPDAEEFYDSTFGKVFKECPGFKGLILVGESIRFPSRDPRTKIDHDEHKYFSPLNIGSPSYPCSDYKELVDLIKKVVNKHTDDVDVVLWSYNWGERPADIRKELIDSLSDDITLQATFETKDHLPGGDMIFDYTISHAGPGYYFATDAEAAHNRGLKVYSMTNSSGKTWDFGVVPYEPMPHKWIDRYNAMREAHDKWGLSGIMENHHYGWYPSFISKLAKWSFWNEPADYDKLLKKILCSEFGEENYETVENALRIFSESMNYFVTDSTVVRTTLCVGTAQTFCLAGDYRLPTQEEAESGSSFWHSDHGHGCDGRFHKIMNVRVKSHLESLIKMHELMHKGVEIINPLEGRNEKLDKLINLLRYLELSAASSVNFKKWYMLKRSFHAETDEKKLSEYLDQMVELLTEEQEVARRSLPLVDRDSSLGWEPSMLYIGHRENIEWKIEQLERTKKLDIGEYRKCLQNSL